MQLLKLKKLNTNL